MHPWSCPRRGLRWGVNDLDEPPTQRETCPQTVPSIEALVLSHPPSPSPHLYSPAHLFTKSAPYDYFLVPQITTEIELSLHIRIAFHVFPSSKLSIVLLPRPVSFIDLSGTLYVLDSPYQFQCYKHHTTICPLPINSGSMD